MPKPINISCNFSQFHALQSFLEEWHNEVKKIDISSIAQSHEIVTAMTEFVRERIGLHLITGDKFGQFMAERTALDITPTSKGFKIEIYGLTEQQLEDEGSENSKVADDGTDYNLWAFYEFRGGSYIPESSGGKRAIQKDTGSVLAIRTRSGGQKTMDTRKGIIRSIIAQIRPEFKKKLDAILTAKLAALVAEAKLKAAKKPPKTGKQALTLNKGKPSKKTDKIPGLTTQMSRQAGKTKRQLEHEILAAGGARIVPSSGSSVRLQGDRGRFISFAPIRGVRVSRG